jgi:hypothetical protein
LLNILVEVTEINYETQLTGASARRRVSYEEDGCGGFGFGRSDEAALEFQVEEVLKVCEFFLGHVIKFTLSKFCPFS